MRFLVLLALCACLQQPAPVKDTDKDTVTLIPKDTVSALPISLPQPVDPLCMPLITETDDPNVYLVGGYGVYYSFVDYQYRWADTDVIVPDCVVKAIEVVWQRELLEKHEQMTAEKKMSAIQLETKTFK